MCAEQRALEKHLSDLLPVDSDGRWNLTCKHHVQHAPRQSTSSAHVAGEDVAATSGHEQQVPEDQSINSVASSTACCSATDIEQMKISAGAPETSQTGGVPCASLPASLMAIRVPPESA